MKKSILIFLIFSNFVLAKDMTINGASRFKVLPISAALTDKMKGVTYQSDCPVPLSQLRLLKLQYWGFDDRPHQGQLIVHYKLALEVVGLFSALYKVHYPIERMQLMHQFKGNDELAMSLNNTSAFNCRAITGHQKKFSKHAYGVALDINPKINPYIKGKVVLPKNSQPFVDRSKPHKGIATSNSFIVKLFKRHGWQWGGDWQSLKDYQHFERVYTQYPCATNLLLKSTI